MGSEYELLSEFTTMSVPAMNYVGKVRAGSKDKEWQGILSG